MTSDVLSSDPAESSHRVSNYHSPGSIVSFLCTSWSVKRRFITSIAIALVWLTICICLALPWISDLSEVLALPGAILLISGFALFPGYLNAFLCSSLLLVKSTSLSAPKNWPSITVLIAAYNEQEALPATVSSIFSSDYPGRIEVIIIDDGSSDMTALVAGALAEDDSRTLLILGDHQGKARALNLGLEKASSDLVVTVDADTLLTAEALSRIVSRLLSSGPRAVATAGAILAHNPKESLVARLQHWDYLLGIASIKRSQSLWQATLVAQGAFSAYYRRPLLDSGGWPDMIGEDIVLTWRLLNQGQTVSFEPTAVAYTSVSVGLRHLVRQRARWARGMIEGLKAHGRDLLARREMVSHGIGINWAFPLIDASYVPAFYPGVALAISGTFLIIGPWTLAVLPVNLFVFAVMVHLQRRVFRELGDRLLIREHLPGLILYWLLYQPLLAPVSVGGYLQELFSRKRNW